jgi:hypothetical protein
MKKRKRERIESIIAHFLLVMGIVLFISIPLWIYIAK